MQRPKKGLWVIEKGEHLIISDRPSGEKDVSYIQSIEGSKISWTPFISKAGKFWTQDLELLEDREFIIHWPQT